MNKSTKRWLKPQKIMIKNLQSRAIGLLAFILVLGFGFSYAGLFYAQIVKGDFFKTKAQTQQLSDTAITAERGKIYDRNMTVLAQSASAWKVSLNAKAFSEIPKEAQEMIYTKLQEILGMSRESLEKKTAYSSYNSVSIKNKIEKDVKDKLNTFLKEKFVDSKGDKQSYNSIIMIDEDVKRYYPYSTLASQIIGFTGTDNTGLSGLEAYYNTLLTGVDGRIISARANSSAAQDVDYKSVYEAKQGTSLVLTIDETIQRYLENALADCYETSKCKSCYGIVMDTKTGGILAMSTKCDYDLNNPYSILDKRTLESLEKIEDEKQRDTAEQNAMYSQWNNKAITDMYEPGSVFKVITMAAGLEENAVKYDETFTCVGHITIADRLYYCHNHSGHGTETLTQGLMNSCNPFFITIGQRLGVQTFNKYFEAFGFTEKTGIDLPGEVSPKKGITYFDRDKMSTVNLASSSFGQSFQVSAIQMLTAINAVANGGKLMQPYVVAKTLDNDGNTVSQTVPKIKRQVISESTAKKILASMEETSTDGTARNSYVSGFHVAGKTGTSDKLNNYGQYIASFAGCAPSNNPEISIIIVVDEPQGATGGGAVAAPVAAEVIENTLTYLNIERQYNDSEKALLDIKVPNEIDNSVSQASNNLESDGFSVKVIGDGDTVVSQMPAFGQYIPQGGVVVLYTENNGKKSRTKVPDFSSMTISEANDTAIESGINIKVSGNSISSTGLQAYRQSVPAGSEIEYGSTITVYFRTTTGVDDH